MGGMCAGIYHGASVQGLRGDEIGIISPYAAQVVGFLVGKWGFEADGFWWCQL